MSAILYLSGCQVDLVRRRVTWPDREERLSQREADLLAFLARAEGVVSREEVEQKVWRMAPGSLSDAVPTAVRRLRKRIEVDPKDPQSLLTAYGEGWRLLVRSPVAVPIEQPPMSLLGRSDLLATLATSTQRIQTLLGPGGVGKTTLVRAAYPGSLFIDLRPASDLMGVLGAISRAVPELRLGGKVVDRLAQVARQLSGRTMVLDNAEHVIDATCRLIVGLPLVRCVVTSRTRLGLPGERIHQVEPLDHEAAVQLFLQRYHEAGGNAPLPADALRQIVRSTDGLPLAIELVAPLARTLPIPQLLSAQQDLLLRSKEGHVDRPMTACLSWSWSLLSSELREAMLAFCPMVGRLTFDAAAKLLEADPAAVLTQLVDQSMLHVEAPGRFRMLALVRAFCLDHAEQRHLRRHAEWTFETYDSLPWTLERTSQVFELVAELAFVTSNPVSDAHLLRAASFLDRSSWSTNNLDPAPFRQAMTQAQSDFTRRHLELHLAQVSYALGSTHELDQIDLDTTNLPPELEIRLLAHVAYLHDHGRSEPPDTRRWRELIDHEPDPVVRCRCLEQLAFSQQDCDVADEAVVAARGSGDPALLVRALACRGGLALTFGRNELAQSDMGEALKLCREFDLRGLVTSKVLGPTAGALATRDRVAAHELMLNILTRYEGWGQVYEALFARACTAVNAWFLGRPEEVLELTRGVDFSKGHGRMAGYVNVFISLAHHELGSGSLDDVRAAFDAYPSGPITELLAQVCLPGPHRSIDDIVADSSANADIISAAAYLRTREANRPGRGAYRRP